MSALVVIAWIDGQRVALPADAVQAVLDLQAVVPVPLAPPHIVGIAAVRSQVLTVIDGALASGRARATEGRRAVIVDRDGHRYAILVDRVDEIVAPTALHPAGNGAIQGWSAAGGEMVEIGDRFALALDPAALVTGPEARQVAA